MTPSANQNFAINPLRGASHNYNLARLATFLYQMRYAWTILQIFVKDPTVRQITNVPARAAEKRNAHQPGKNAILLLNIKFSTLSKMMLFQ